MRFNIRMLLAVTLVCAVLARPVGDLITHGGGFVVGLRCGFMVAAAPVLYLARMESKAKAAWYEMPNDRRFGNIPGAVIGVFAGGFFDLWVACVVFVLCRGILTGRWMPPGSEPTPPAAP